MKDSDLHTQQRLLPGVSRTFALTIPQLPIPLRDVITNAYLLCRIADTIEDDAGLEANIKAHYHAHFREVLTGQYSAVKFAEELYPQLSERTPIPERELIQNIPTVIRCLHHFTSLQQQSLQRCVNIMSTGMPEFQRRVSLQGLANTAELDRYCYFVAGVVGEMLTELFCDYSAKIASCQDQLMNLAVSFGQGLQMTNILKDFWEDRQRGVCWLPQEIFQQHGVNLAEASLMRDEFAAPLKQLIGMARKHLDNALKYTLLIPANETGIRRFCLWAIGLAILTLRNIYHNPTFHSGAEVKVNRRTLKTTIAVSNLCCRNNDLLEFLFQRLTREIV